MFQTTYESRPCPCGGRRNEIPSNKLNHLETKRHTQWRWRSLCEAFLDLSLPRETRIAMLKEMKTLVGRADEPLRVQAKPREATPT
jgi:hypothetical protein